jgi:hypothetical protein
MRPGLRADTKRLVAAIGFRGGAELRSFIAVTKIVVVGMVLTPVIFWGSIGVWVYSLLS